MTRQGGRERGGRLGARHHSGRTRQAQFGRTDGSGGAAAPAIALEQADGLAVPVTRRLLPGRPGDREEGVADRMAERALGPVADASPVAGPSPLAAPAYGPDPASAALRRQLEEGSDRGVPLSDDLRAWLESRMGVDLGAIRIHTGEASMRTAERLHSRAFAFGPHLVFAPGQFRPDTPDGRRLLAHEVAHAVGQLRPGGAAAVVQRDAPMGTVETSAGEERIEGMEVTANAADIRARLLAGEAMINNRIDAWVRENFDHVAASLESAAESFENWYQAHASSSSSGFVPAVVGAGLGILGALYPPAAVVTAVLGNVLNVANAAANAAAAARRQARGNRALAVEQAMINKAVELRNSAIGFAARMKREGGEAERVWTNVGLALTMNDPNMVPIAREELYNGAGLPPLNRGYTERALADMILAYNHWERVTSLRESVFFVSSRDLTWAIWNDVQRRRWAERQARRQLGRRP